MTTTAHKNLAIALAAALDTYTAGEMTGRTFAECVEGYLRQILALEIDERIISEALAPYEKGKQIPRA